MTTSYPYLANYWFAASRIDKLIPLAEYAKLSTYTLKLYAGVFYREGCLD
jgi:hypothetical protein